jgi:hypothetical protein
MIHPRDNDLILATHGRGIWILDSVSSLQELTPQVLTAGAGLFSIRPAAMIRFAQPKAHAGDMMFRGENPPAGAIVDYYLGRADAQVALSVHDAAGTLVTTLEPLRTRGVNRVVWNLRHAQVAAPSRRASASDDEDGGGGGGFAGPFVVPGAYIVEASSSMDGHRAARRRRRPARVVAPTVRADGRRRCCASATPHRAVSAPSTGADGRRRHGCRSGRARGPRAPPDRQGTADTRRLLYRAERINTGPLTADQRQQLQFFDETRARLAAQASPGQNR